jgi:hypothetical protein
LAFAELRTSFVGTNRSIVLRAAAAKVSRKSLAITSLGVYLRGLAMGSCQKRSLTGSILT